MHPLPPPPPPSPPLLPTADQILQAVEQSELEKFDGVSTGKYTIGLGQTKMAFCDDREGMSDSAAFPWPPC